MGSAATNPTETVVVLEKVLVEYPSVPYDEAMNVRPTYSYVLICVPFTLVMKGNKI